MDYTADELQQQHSALRASLLQHLRQAPESREPPGLGPSLGTHGLRGGPGGTATWAPVPDPHARKGVVLILGLRARRDTDHASAVQGRP